MQVAPRKPADGGEIGQGTRRLDQAAWAGRPYTAPGSAMRQGSNQLDQAAQAGRPEPGPGRDMKEAGPQPS